MSVGASLQLSISDLPKAHAAALRRKARQVGLTPIAYVKQLIADDVTLDEQAAKKSFADLSAPFASALQAVSEKDLNRIARRPARRKAKR